MERTPKQFLGVRENSLGILVKFLQRNRTNRRLYICIYKQELAPVIVAAKKSHDLPFASQRTREAGGAMQSKSKGVRIWRLMV